MVRDEPPPGYTAFVVGQARVVCTESVAEALRTALRDTTLYEYAERHPNARPLAGRGTSYLIPLPGVAERVVVRHNRHGGLLAPVTGDLFRAPTRAPLELRISERLRSRGVPTPRVLGYVTYGAPRGLERADVMTREVENSSDLSAALMSADSETRGRALKATAQLVACLSAAGARHHDLNIKNVLLSPAGDGAFQAFVLDVDRVTFGSSASQILEANLARLIRSARKWQSKHGALVTDAEIDELAAGARGQVVAAAATLS